jgi:hypothetical protein
LTSKFVVVTTVTTLIFLVLVSFSPSILSLQQQQAEASAYGLGSTRVPPAYIIVDGKASKLQLENDPFQVNDEERIADYSRPPQGTISFGERFSLLVPQFLGVIKDVKSTTLWVNDDVANSQDDFHVNKQLVNVRDTRLLYTETYVINAPGGVGDGYTASEIGFRIFLWWDVLFADGTEQTYLAIVYLQGDPCEEHGWDYSTTSNRKCVDHDF